MSFWTNFGYNGLRYNLPRQIIRSVNYIQNRFLDLSDYIPTGVFLCQLHIGRNFRIDVFVFMNDDIPMTFMDILNNTFNLRLQIIER